MNDIEILEKLIKEFDEFEEKQKLNVYMLTKKERQAIENLINRVKELEEELEKEKRNNRWKENEQKELLKYKTIKIENSISKDKIKEIIKDLELFDEKFYNTETLKSAFKNSLQELLEE